MNKNVLTGEVWIMQQSYFLLPAVRKIPEYSGSIVNWKEEVEENVLQEALDQTIEKYPVFLSVMRKGLFWHYLEKSELRPIVRKEYKEPCSSLYVRDKKTLLFEVTYYKKRINFEVFHALTDGTGATEFLRELVKNYLHLVHKDELEPVELSDQYLTVKDQEDDSFSRYYDPDFPRKKKKKIKAFQIKKNGKGYEELQVNEATVPVKRTFGHQQGKGSIHVGAFNDGIHMCNS